MDLTQQVDIYCERLGPGLLAEPLNLITNLGFIVAGVLGMARARRLPAGGGWLWALAIVVTAIGIGSGLFHSFATRWAGLADVIPIGIYMYLFVGFAGGVLLRGGWLGAAVACGALYVALAAGRALPSEWFNGSNGYFGAALGLLVLGLMARSRAFPFANLLIAAVAVFVVSLTFRSIDMLICPSVSIGTHFLWHLLNAVVLYLTLLAADVGLRHRAAPAVAQR